MGKIHTQPARDVGRQCGDDELVEWSSASASPMAVSGSASPSSPRTSKPSARNCVTACRRRDSASNVARCSSSSAESDAAARETGAPGGGASAGREFRNDDEKEAGSLGGATPDLLHQMLSAQRLIGDNEVRAHTPLPLLRSSPAEPETHVPAAHRQPPPTTARAACRPLSSIAAAARTTRSSTPYPSSAGAALRKVVVVEPGGVRSAVGMAMRPRRWLSERRLAA